MNTAVGITGLHRIAGNRVQSKNLSGYDCRSHRCPDGRENFIPIPLKLTSGIIFDKADGVCFFYNRKVTASRTHSGGDRLGNIHRADPGILRMVFVTDQFSDILIIDFAGITCIKRGADFTDNSFAALVISSDQCRRYTFIVNINLPHIKALDLIHIRFNHALQSAFIRHKLTVTGASNGVSLIATVPPYRFIRFAINHGITGSLFHKRGRMFIAFSRPHIEVKAACFFKSNYGLIITGSKGMTQVVSN